MRHLKRYYPNYLQKLNDEGKPLVIIIDELDRCKPTYALDMIEKVKHLFSVKNVVFVLVMNKEQIDKSVECIYGQSKNSHEYLQKFINIDVKLPIDTNITTNFIYTENLYDKMNFVKWANKVKIIEFSNYLSVHFKLSLRELEKVFTNISLFYLSSIENEKLLIPIIVFLSILKVKESELFHQIPNRTLSFEDLIKQSTINLLDESEEKNKFLKYSLYNHLKLCIFDMNKLRSLNFDDPISDLISYYDFLQSNKNPEKIFLKYYHKFSMFNIS